MGQQHGGRDVRLPTVHRLCAHLTRWPSSTPGPAGSLGWQVGPSPAATPCPITRDCSQCLCSLAPAAYSWCCRCCWCDVRPACAQACNTFHGLLQATPCAAGERGQWPCNAIEARALAVLRAMLASGHSPHSDAPWLRCQTSSQAAIRANYVYLHVL